MSSSSMNLYNRTKSSLLPQSKAINFTKSVNSPLRFNNGKFEQRSKSTTNLTYMKYKERELIRDTLAASTSIKEDTESIKVRIDHYQTQIDELTAKYDEAKGGTDFKLLSKLKADLDALKLKQEDATMQLHILEDAKERFVQEQKLEADILMLKEQNEKAMEELKNKHQDELTDISNGLNEEYVKKEEELNTKYGADAPKTKEMETLEAKVEEKRQEEAWEEAAQINERLSHLAKKNEFDWVNKNKMYVKEKLRQFKAELNQRFDKEKKLREKAEFERRAELDTAFEKVVRDAKKGKFKNEEEGTGKFDEYFVNHNKSFLAKYEKTLLKATNKEKVNGSRSLSNLYDPFHIQQKEQRSMLSQSQLLQDQGHLVEERSGKHDYYLNKIEKKGKKGEADLEIIPVERTEKYQVGPFRVDREVHYKKTNYNIKAKPITSEHNLEEEYKGAKYSLMSKSFIDRQMGLHSLKTFKRNLLVSEVMKPQDTKPNLYHTDLVIPMKQKTTPLHYEETNDKTMKKAREELWGSSINEIEFSHEKLYQYKTASRIGQLPATKFADGYKVENFKGEKFLRKTENTALNGILKKQQEYEAPYLPTDDELKKFEKVLEKSSSAPNFKPNLKKFPNKQNAPKPDQGDYQLLSPMMMKKIGMSDKLKSWIATDSVDRLVPAAADVIYEKTLEDGQPDKTSRRFVVHEEPDSGPYDYTPKVDYENFKECSPVKEREGRQFSEYLHQTAQDKKRFYEKMEENWAKIYQNECTFKPTLTTKFEYKERPKNIFTELYNKKPEPKTYSNKECTFQPNLKN